MLRALTLVEMMVAVTLLSVIILGLTAMFVQTQKAFKAGVNQMDKYESGRSIMALISQDMEQMSDGQLAGQQVYITNFYANLFHQTPFVQVIDSNVPIYRTNYLEDVYNLSRISNNWIAIGYIVSNTYTMPGVGTLYRYYYATNTVIPSTNLYLDFTRPWTDPIFTSRLHRVADGVIHLSARAFGADGAEITTLLNTGGAVYWVPPPFPVVDTNYIYGAVPANLPSYVEIELGILDPDTLAQARSMNNSNAVYNFLSIRPNKVQIYRQQIPIHTAPTRTLP